MSTQRQMEANKLNAQRSTGPRTANGKRRVASNALRHGLTGKQIVLPNEDPHEFDAFRDSLWSNCNPQGAVGEVLVGKIVADAWRPKRVPMLEAAVYARDRLLDIEAKIEQAQRFLDPEEALQDAAPEKPVRKAAMAAMKKANIWLDEPTLEIAGALSECAPEFQSLLRHELALTKSMLRVLHELERLQMRRGVLA